jgi:uncharacterized protein
LFTSPAVFENISGSSIDLCRTEDRPERRNMMNWRSVLVILFVAAGASPVAKPPAGEGAPSGEGVVATLPDSHFVLRALSPGTVELRDGFWAPKLRVNQAVSLPSLYDLLEENGIVDNFRRLAGSGPAERRGPLYTDSDLYKWMEAAAHTLWFPASEELSARLDELIPLLASAQEEDGYLNTYYSLERRGERWTNFLHGHELYCLGHLIQAAVAHFRATGGRRDLLDIAIRFANHVVDTFGAEKEPAFAGHPEAEMAFVELYRATGDRRYLDFARYLLLAEKTGLPIRDRDIVYTFSFIPYTERTVVEGHSVRCMYANAGAADVFAETGDPLIRQTLDRLWKDLVSGKMYLTGGLGSRELGEAIGEPFELPNERAYTETCAAIGNFMWNWRMLLLTGQARFADLAEQALYNGVLSGVSLTGREYFYRNPLESRGGFQRQQWYATTCCPPNIQRTLASLPGYFYSTGDRGIWVHFYDRSQVRWTPGDGVEARLEQETTYPWGFDVAFDLNLSQPTEFSLFLRVPVWSSGASIRVNGASPSRFEPDGYAEIRREWRTGDRVEVEFLSPLSLLESNPRLRENRGRVAVRRGPLIYCVEGHEIPPGRSVFDLSLPLGTEREEIFRSEFLPDLLGGVTVLRAKARFQEPGWAGMEAYFPRGGGRVSYSGLEEVTLVPYFAWANRGPAEMQVWHPHPSGP